MGREGIDVSPILRALSAHRAKADLLAHRITAGCKPVGGLLEFGLIGANFDRLDTGHASEITSHAKALIAEQDRRAVEAIIVDAMLGKQSEVEDRPERRRPAGADAERLEVDQGRMGAVAL